MVSVFFFSSRRRHTRFDCDWSSDVCSSDLAVQQNGVRQREVEEQQAAGRGLTGGEEQQGGQAEDRKSTRLNSSHSQISYAVFCLKKKKTQRLYKSPTTLHSTRSNRHATSTS